MNRKYLFTYIRCGHTLFTVSTVSYGRDKYTDRKEPRLIKEEKCRVYLSRRGLVRLESG